ncbi:MAG TPA: hypothetical protein VEL76_27810 [Gemmataceae bacterium]|nr:hypothetical protein [Gemmataceae bacterium]
MKHSSTKVRKGKSTKVAQPKPVTPKREGNVSFLPRWALSVLCLLLVGGGTWATFEFVVWNKLPSQLLGKWVIEGGEQDGATLDFFRNGTMIGRMNVRGSLAIVNGRAAVEGNKLFITTQNPQTRQEETQAQTIKVLTSEELIVEDGKGKTFRLSRASTF